MVNLQKAVFLRSAAAQRDFPGRGVRQIVFAGRSNAGKSSVINCILGRKNLARTGQKPGKTVHVNLFQIEPGLVFTDLPGYGFARVSQQEKQRWGELISSYFACCGGDMALGVLVFDARRDPTDEDMEMARLFESLSVPYIICANKCDKLGRSELEPAAARIASAFGVEREKVLLCSAATGEGKAELVRCVLSFCE